jgi:hypothetical protein
MFPRIIHVLSYIYFRWPRLAEICRKVMYKGIPNFKKLVQIRLKCKTQLRNFLVELNRRWYNVIDNLVKYNYLCNCLCVQKRTFKDGGNFHVDKYDLDFLIRRNNNGHRMNYYFIMDELTDILEESKR